MAATGLKYPVYGIITKFNDGAAPTYSTPGVIGKAIKADVTFNSAEGKLYADDALAEYASKFTDGSIVLGIDDITEAKKAALLGYTLSAVSGSNKLIMGAADVAPHVGIGYYKTHMIDGVRKYRTYFFYDVVFRETGDSSETANESITFSTPEITGTILPVQGYGKDNYAEIMTFDSEASAKTHLHELVG
ncbi:MAG: hypothetical protein IIY21_14360, partial [Clostridiales bacterium]|nr:hypothetical protein [Clostridiales bacterium]